MKHNEYQQCDIMAMQQLSVKEAEQNELAFAPFGVVEKNGEIQLVTAFWKLNEMYEWLEFHIPKNDETL